VSSEGVFGLCAKSGKSRTSGLTKKIEDDLKIQLLKKPAELGYTQAI
jgi:hypothetical protein